MPLYDFSCDACQVVVEHLARPEETVRCDCGAPMRRLISVPSSFPPELAPYYDTGLGMRITSRAERRKKMKELHLAEKGTSQMHGAKGTVWSFPGQTTQKVEPSGAYAKRRG